MISKRTIKYLRSLSKKKTQVIEKKFIVEGIRFFKEAVDSDFEIESVFILDSLVNEPEIQKILELLAQNHPDSILQTIKKSDLELISETSTPQGILAVMHQKCWNLSDLYSAKQVVALENITDPGNLGTIIRTADWFGIDALVISSGSVHLFNSKVLRSTMGSLFHLPIFENMDLLEILCKLKKNNVRIFISDLTGSNYWSFPHSESYCLVMGSEAHGVSDTVRRIGNDFVTIPSYGKADSLNTAIAAAILMAHFGNK